jgi:ribosomal-protein-alanine N-acetyltransferase
MIKFRPATASDMANIMKLEESCFNKYTQEAREIYVERIEVFPDGFIILEVDGQFAGAISSEVWQYVPEANRDMFFLGHSIKKQLKLDGDELYISSIGIFPEYRSQGFGEALLEELIRNIKLKYPKVKQGILLLSEEWKHARRIYVQNNFMDCGVFEGFFTNDDGKKVNGIVMRKGAL